MEEMVGQCDVLQRQNGYWSNHVSGSKDVEQLEWLIPLHRLSADGRIQ
jgi:hypothetical protein